MYLLNLLISFRGRVDRLEFIWGFMLSNIIVGILIFFPNLFKHIYGSHSIYSVAQAIFFVVGFILFIVSNLALAKKRLYDLQWTTWLLPLFIIPGIDIIMKIIGITVPGKQVGPE